MILFETGFKQNKEFNAKKWELELQGEKFCRERRLEPNNPKSLYKTFYHNRIVEEFDKYYTKKLKRAFCNRHLQKSSFGDTTHFSANRKCVIPILMLIIRHSHNIFL